MNNVKEDPEIEQFVNSYSAYFYIEYRDDHIVIKGTFDDFNPEPERTNIDEELSKMKRDIEWNDEFPIPVKKVSDVIHRYASLSIRVYPK